MANENMIKFLRGNVADLPQTATAGALYFTKDEGVYLGLENGSYHRYGDFITVADVSSLPTTGAHATCMYYCTSENILARYDSVKGWIQINKQPTADEMKTLLGLGSLAYLSEVAEDNLSSALKEKVNAASEGNHSHNNKELLDTYTQTDADLKDAVDKKHTHANADELAKIADGDKAKWDAVVADHLTSADKTTLENSIKEAKKAGTDANTALETYKVTNDARVLAVEEDIAEITNADNGILAQAKAYADGKDSAIAEAKKAGTDANAALEAYKTSNDSALAGVKATADAAAVKTEVETALAGKVDKVEGKSLIADSEITRLASVTNYDDTTVKADIAKKADAATMTTELGKKVDKVEGYSLVTDTEIARLADVDNYDDGEVRGLIGDNADAIDALAGKVGDVPEGQTVMGIITNIQENAYDDTEIRGLISDNAEAIEAINNAETGILKTAKDYADGIVAAEKERAEGIEGGLRTDVDAIKADYLKASDKEALQTQINTIMSNPDAEGAINSINEFTQYVADHGTIADGMRADINKNKEDIAAINSAETGILKQAKDYADGLAGNYAEAEHDHVVADITDFESAVATKVESYGYATTGQVATAKQEAIDAAATDAQGKVDALANGQVKTNTEAIATKANSADVYAKTETFTKDEVNAAIAAAVEEAHTWGSF